MKTLFLILALWGSQAWAQSQPILELPNRPAQALSGSAFLKKIAHLSGAKRENAMVQEVLKGNVPSFLRQLVAVEKRVVSGPHKGKLLRYYTLPDYLAVGSDEDFVRVPLNLHSVNRLSERLDVSLPTAKMVDEIYSQARVKLTPSPLTGKKQVSATSNIAEHSQLLRAQFSSLHLKPGMLVAGHKKDVVQSRRLLKKPNAIAIYGWHRKVKDPIQPLSTAHSAEYADYSHGIRLVSNTVEIDGRAYDLQDMHESQSFASLLSNEGVIPQLAHHVRTTGTSLAIASHP